MGGNSKFFVGGFIWFYTSCILLLTCHQAKQAMLAFLSVIAAMGSRKRLQQQQCECKCDKGTKQQQLMQLIKTIRFPLMALELESWHPTWQLLITNIALGKLYSERSPAGSTCFTVWVPTVMESTVGKSAVFGKAHFHVVHHRTPAVSSLLCQCNPIFHFNEEKSVSWWVIVKPAIITF